MPDLMKNLNLFDKLIIEHGSSVVFEKHINLLKEQVSLYDSENKTLKSQVKNLNIEVNNLKEHINIAENRNDYLENKILAIHSTPPIKFNQLTGTWIDNKSGEHFCPSCKSKNIMSPMRIYDSGWECPIKECKTFQKNPEHTDSGAIFVIKNGAN